MSTPLVFLHPLGADARFWEPVLAELDCPQATTLDLPGHGSALLPPVGAGIDTYAAPVGRHIAALGEPAHLVGMSLGGLVAQQLAAAHPDLVASAVLVDTVPTYPEVLRQSWRQRAETARRGELSTLVQPMVEMWFSAQLAAAQDARVEQARLTFAATDPEGYARTCDVLADVDLRDSVASLAVPAAVVCGEDDAPAFRDGAAWLAEATGAALHWLPGRHACAVEHPKLFAELVKATTAG